LYYGAIFFRINNSLCGIFLGLVIVVELKEYEIVATVAIRSEACSQLIESVVKLVASLKLKKAIA